MCGYLVTIPRGALRMVPMTKPRDDSPFPTSLDQPDVNVSRNRVAKWLDSSIDTVGRIKDGPKWFHITDRLVRSSAHDWIRWLLQKQEEERLAAAAAARAPALPAPAESEIPQKTTWKTARVQKHSAQGAGSVTASRRAGQAP